MQGIDLIVWTFDPLQSRNAYLNIEKLGCIIREYSVNIYPGSGSQFNAGLETDRFTPEWWIGSRRVKDRIAGKRPAYDLKAYPAAARGRAPTVRRGPPSGWHRPTCRSPRRTAGRPGR